MVSFFFLSFCVSSRGRAKRFVLEASSRVRRAKRHAFFARARSSSSSRKKKQKQKSRGALSERFFLCVCGSDDGGGGVRDILSLVVVEKKHNTKSNWFGLERELDRIW